MDGQDKQKVMIAVLTVAVLGAGASFFAFRNSRAGGANAANTGAVARRVPEPSPIEEETMQRVRPTKSRESKPKTPAIRRPRNEEDRKTATNRDRKRTDRKRPKKESTTPAA